MKRPRAGRPNFMRGLDHGGGTFHSIVIMEGDEGSIGDFQLSYRRSGGEFFSPRHRYNFKRSDSGGSGDLSQAEIRAGTTTPAADGRVWNGVLRHPADIVGKRNIDGYRAIWEH